ncbi:MAG: OadG family protein [Gemmatimonadota bacterium]|nr:OadG family protein [Gemmatimonadota bacterium]
MYNFNFSMQNIEDGQGLGIALTGMIIVFSVLTLISAFIVILPKILAVVAKKFP